MYPEYVEPHAPKGKIRVIGTEHGKDFLIRDLDENTSPDALASIIDEERGVGIDIRVVGDEDEDNLNDE